MALTMLVHFWENRGRMRRSSTRAGTPHMRAQNRHDMGVQEPSQKLVVSWRSRPLLRKVHDNPGSARGPFGVRPVDSGSSWSIRGSVAVHPVDPGSIRGPSRAHPGSIRGRRGAAPGRRGVHLGPIRGRLAVDAEAIRGRSCVCSGSIRGRSRHDRGASGGHLCGVHLGGQPGASPRRACRSSASPSPSRTVAGAAGAAWTCSLAAPRWRRSLAHGLRCCQGADSPQAAAWGGGWGGRLGEGRGAQTRCATTRCGT